MADLKPCPMCGAAAEMYYPFHLMGRPGSPATYNAGVQCKGCGCRIGATNPPDNAISAWNRRASAAMGQVPEGWTLVPVKASQAMIDAISHAIKWDEPVWPAAIAAAPTPPATSADDALERFKNPMTPYGMLVRALRIVSDTLLMDMARDLQTTPATLSAYECGRKPIPPELAEHAANFFARNGIPDTLRAIDAALRAGKEGRDD